MLSIRNQNNLTIKFISDDAYIAKTYFILVYHSPHDGWYSKNKKYLRGLGR